MTRSVSGEVKALQRASLAAGLVIARARLANVLPTYGVLPRTGSFALDWFRPLFSWLCFLSFLIWDALRQAREGKLTALHAAAYAVAHGWRATPTTRASSLRCSSRPRSRHLRRRGRRADRGPRRAGLDQPAAGLRSHRADRLVAGLGPVACRSLERRDPDALPDEPDQPGHPPPSMEADLGACRGRQDRGAACRGHRHRRQRGLDAQRHRHPDQVRGAARQCLQQLADGRPADRRCRCPPTSPSSR